MANVGIYDMTDTWNNAGTAFTAIKMNVTDTASASGSKLLDIQKGGSSLLVVDKSGNMDIGGTLDVTGATTLDSTLTVANDTTIGSTSNPANLFVTESGTGDTTVLTLANYETDDTGDETSSLLFMLTRSYTPSLSNAGFIKVGKERSWTSSSARDSFMSFSTRLGATEPTERMRITSDGYLRMASGSGGIQFNGDTAAANALDDYEEGSFTPSLSAETPPASPAAGSGSYIKVGGVVHFELEFLNVSTGGSGYLLVTGLPFTKSGGINYPINVTMSYLIDTIPFAGRVQGSTIDFFDIKDLTYRTPTSTGSGRYLYVTGTYRVT